LQAKASLRSPSDAEDPKWIFLVCSISSSSMPRNSESIRRAFGILACSGDALTALASMHSKLTCAVMMYAFMLDLDGSTLIAQMAAIRLCEFRIH